MKYSTTNVINLKAAAECGTSGGSIVLVVLLSVGLAINVVTFTFAFSIISAVLFSSTVISTIISTAGDDTVGILVAIVIAGVGVVGVIFDRGMTLIGQNKIGLGLAGIYLLGLMLLALWSISTYGVPEQLADGMMIWTILLFLPTLNALFDLASLQLSRWFLTQIKRQGRIPNILWILADILAAIVLLICLYGTIFLCLEAVDHRLFPAVQLFTVDRWRELFWDERDWFHPEILWLTLMASTTLIVTVIHLVFAFAHLFVPLWHSRDQENIVWLIREFQEKVAAHPEKKPSDADCRALATAYYLPWEHGIVLGTLTLWMAGYLLYTLIAQ